MVFKEAGGGGGLCRDGGPRPGHAGAALQAVIEAGVSGEAEEVTATAVPRESEPGTKADVSEDVGRAGSGGAVVALVTVRPSGVAVLATSPNHHRAARHRH